MNADSLYGWFNGPSGGIEAHFHVKLDGTVEQYRSIYYECDANYKANPFAVSIETQGYGSGKWTNAQLESIKELLEWLNKEAGIPLVKCSKWDGSGVGYHIQFGSPGYWTNVAKSCPGPDRIWQFNTILVPWFKKVKRSKRNPGKRPTKVTKARDSIEIGLELLKDAQVKRLAVRRMRRAIAKAMKNGPQR